MKRLLLALVLGAGSATLVIVTGCGSSSGGGSSATAAETTASCNAHCEALFAKPCPDPSYTSVADCKASDCGVAVPAVPANCQGKLKAYYDCLNGQADICNEAGCLSELNTAGNCR